MTGNNFFWTTIIEFSAFTSLLNTTAAHHWAVKFWCWEQEPWGTYTEEKYREASVFRAVSHWIWLTTKAYYFWSLISIGSAFQMEGVTTENARRWAVEDFTRGTKSSPTRGLSKRPPDLRQGSKVPAARSEQCRRGSADYCYSVTDSPRDRKPVQGIRHVSRVRNNFRDMIDETSGRGKDSSEADQHSRGRPTITKHQWSSWLMTKAWTNVASASWDRDRESVRRKIWSNAT